MSRNRAAVMLLGALLVPLSAARGRGAIAQKAAQPKSGEQPEAVEGAVLAAARGELTVELEAGQLATFRVTGTTEFRGVDALRDLDPGDRVRVTSRPSGGGREAEVVELASVAGVVGVIESLGKNSFAVKREADGALVNVTVNERTHYHGRRLGIEFKDLRTGDRVIAVVKPGKARLAQFVDVTAVPAAGSGRQGKPQPGETTSVVGLITRLSADCLTLRRPDGTLVALRLSSRTRFAGSGVRSWKDCRAGQRVAVAARRARGALVATSVNALARP